MNAIVEPKYIMPKDPDLAISFVKAIEHGHIPVDESQTTADQTVLCNDPKSRGEQQDVLLSMLEGVDAAVTEIDV